MTAHAISPLASFRIGRCTLIFTDLEAARLVLSLPRELSHKLAEDMISGYRLVGPQGNLRPDGTIGDVVVVEDHPLLMEMPERAWVGYNRLKDHLAYDAPDVPMTPRLEALAAQFGGSR